MKKIMGNLPPEQLTVSCLFAYVGVDFAGIFSVKCTNHRSTKYLKYYAAFFTCLVTHAAHIETVPDLTTKAFIAALQRFAARRGIPRTIMFDNATN